MMRWIRVVTATALWAFVLTGLVGLCEAAAQYVRFGAPTGGEDFGLLRLLAPPFTLYGWVGMITALVVAVPVALVVQWRGGSMRTIFGWAVASALGLIIAVYFGYLVAGTSFWTWWTESVGPGWPLKGLLWFLASAVLAGPLARFAGRLVSNPRRNMFLPVVVVVVATALWPDWRDEAADRHVGHLERLGGETVAPDGYDVLLVTIDTLRRDRLSCLSEHAPPTPNLDALAAEGILYANTWTTSSWTLPNMATILTGLAPRMLDLGRAAGLPEAAPTLAESAWRAGWRTVALASNPYLGYDYGFEKGFASFDHATVLEPLDPAQRSVLVRELTRYTNANTTPDDASVMVRKALRWYRADRDQRPVFLWMHMMDPHLPYRWHPLPGDDAEPVLPDSGLFAADHFMGLLQLRDMAPAPDPEILAAVEMLYDREVRYVDAWVGRLLDALRESGRLERTIVVVTADHGEEFFEHGGYEHGHTLMPEVTTVPLIVRLPDGRGSGRRVERETSLADITPSLCRELGWDLPAGAPGRSDLWDDDASADSPSRVGVLENMLYGPPRQAWLRWPDFKTENLESGRVDWYDLAADPGARQARGVAPADGDSLAARVGELLRAWDERAHELGTHERDDASLSDATVRQLESLGY